MLHIKTFPDSRVNETLGNLTPEEQLLLCTQIAENPIGGNLFRWRDLNIALRNRRGGKTFPPTLEAMAQRLEVRRNFLEVAGIQFLAAVLRVFIWGIRGAGVAALAFAVALEAVDHGDKISMGGLAVASSFVTLFVLASDIAVNGLRSWLLNVLTWLPENQNKLVQQLMTADITSKNAKTLIRNFLLTHMHPEMTSFQEPSDAVFYFNYWMYELISSSYLLYSAFELWATWCYPKLNVFAHTNILVAELCSSDTEEFLVGAEKVLYKDSAEKAFGSFTSRYVHRSNETVMINDSVGYQALQRDMKQWAAKEKETKEKKEVDSPSENE